MIELMQTIEVNSVDPHDTKHLDSSNFQKTEIGQIPKDWELVDLGAVSIISRLAGAEYTSVWRESPSGEIIALRGFNIEKNKINLRDIVRISDKLSRKLKRSRLTKGDVVYPCVGTIGNAAVIYEDDTYHIQQNIARITPDTSRVKSEFLSHYLTSSFAEKEVEKFNATSSQPNVLVSSLRQYKVPLPKTLNEQTAIANALSDVDALIQELEKLIAKKQAIKTATMQQLLTGRTRLPQFAHHPDGRKKGYKPSELGEIPEDWEVYLFGDVTDSCSSGGTPFRGNKSYYSGTNRWITSGELNYCVINDTIEKISDEAIKKSNLKVHPVGTFLMAITGLEAAGTRGACGIVGAPAATNQSCMAIYPNEKLLSTYLYYWYVYNGQELAFKYCQGTKQLSYTAGLLKTIPINLPTSQDEQSAISAILYDMDSEINSLNQRLFKTRQIKQGMMQELLTGKTRLVKPAGAA